MFLGFTHSHGIRFHILLDANKICDKFLGKAKTCIYKVGDPGVVIPAVGFYFYIK